MFTFAHVVVALVIGAYVVVVAVFGFVVALANLFVAEVISTEIRDSFFFIQVVRAVLGAEHAGTGKRITAVDRALIIVVTELRWI